MDVERIWAPWRLGYVAGNEQAPERLVEPTTWRPHADRACFMCRAAAQYAEEPAARHQNLVVRVGEHTLTMLNRFPYANGHLLVAPLRHVGELSGMTSQEQLESIQTASHMIELLSQLLKSEGFNLGLNLGRAAGAGVPGHLHWHIVPRWSGDNNFMPTTAGTRVIPQSLEALWEALLHAVEAGESP